MLELSITVFNAHLMGKGQQEIKDEMARGYEKLSRQFKNLQSARKFQDRLQGDLESVSARGSNKPPSISNETDTWLPMRKFFDGSATVDGTEGGNDDNSHNMPALQPPSDIPPLLQAAKAGNSQEVRALLSMGTFPSSRGFGDDRTALHICAIYDDVATAEVLLQHGADINAKDSKSRSPLRVAISSESYSVAALLIRKGCVLENTMVPALLDAIHVGETITSSKDFLASLQERLGNSSDGAFLLHGAIERNDVTTVRLITAGFSPNIPDEHGKYHFSLILLYKRKP
jgi:hypothetical protein